jgi:hypothetical protein
MHMPQQLEDLQKFERSVNSQNQESDQNCSESNFSTNKEQKLMKEVEYLDCVIKATELEGME